MKKKLLSLAVASLVCGSIAEARFYIGVEGGYTGGIPKGLNNRDLGSSNEVKFVGISGSSISNSLKTETLYQDGEKTEVEPFRGFNVGLSFGSEHFFLRDYLGLRWGVSVGYTGLSQITNSYNATYGDSKVTRDMSFLDSGLSFDLMTNFYSSQSFAIGVFGGAELDYHYMLTGKYKHEEVNDSVSFDLKNAVPSRHTLDLAGRVGLSMLIASHHRIDLTAKLPIGYIVAGKESKAKLTSPISTTAFNVGYKFVF